MEKGLEFRFEVPKPPNDPMYEVTAEEAEELLLRRLSEEADTATVLWELARFYSHSRQHEKALARLRELMQRQPDPEAKAGCVLAMGQTMEQVNDYPAAIRYYKEAEALEPMNSHNWYFINNNLGFSLNTLNKFVEGEIYCRRAIGIEPQRPNAHKNLGIALAGRGQYQEAARCFVTATQVNAADPRAFHLLEELLKEHPELEFDFRNDVECCRKAIEMVQRKANELKPVVHRGWRKQLFLIKTRIRSVLRMVWR